MNPIHSPQCGKDIEAIVTNLVEIRKEELTNIQSHIGAGLAKITKMLSPKATDAQKITQQ